VTGCGQGDVDTTAPVTQQSHQLTAQEAHGREVWLKSSFGGEKFFTIYGPAVMGFHLGFDAMLLTPRAERFSVWGVVNDPDCTAGGPATGGLDNCPWEVDADGLVSSAGVVGIRKRPNPFFNPGQPPGPANSPYLIGSSCAGCHAGLDPANPPADPNNPSWDNIHVTTGGQYEQIGKIFGAHLPDSDFRKQVFNTWAPGTVDTTAIESDHINNPGIITQFFNFPDRPFFDLHFAGAPINVHRAGQGGEDDAGCVAAATRVYFNIGMCSAECMLPHLTNGPGGTQTPINQAECAQICPEYVREQQDVVDLCAFIQTTTPPAIPHDRVDWTATGRGKQVFREYCASCHQNRYGIGSEHQDFTDDILHKANGLFSNEAAGEIGTNSCRSKSTNWQGGHIWAEFSSDEQRARGTGYYRDVPLLGIWATAPFFHNNRLGLFNNDPSIDGRLAAYEDAMDKLLNPWNRTPIVDRTSTLSFTPPPLVFPVPAGTPVAAVANLNPLTFQNNCPDFVENEGHYFGALLSPDDKYALTEYMKTF
jgi:mono/diheme cytochrome c family protein